MSDAHARHRYIDFLKGVCCIMMMVAHAMLVDVVFHDHMDPANLTARVFIYVAQLVVPIFYMASGINSHTFLERYGTRPEFDATRFYLWTALVLFFGGYTYSLLVTSFAKGVPDIFQGVAMGVAFSYLVIRVKTPPWAMTLIACAIFAIGVGHRMVFTATAETFAVMPAWERFAFGHFAFFPWGGYFVLGVVLFRLRSTWTPVIWAAIFLIIGIVGLFTPGTLPEAEFQVMFRVDLRFFLIGSGLSGIILLASAHHYPASPGRALTFVEYVGRESLLFLIFHALILGVLIILFQGRMNLYVRAALETGITLGLLRRVAAYRDRRAQRPGFEKRSWIIVAVFTAISILLLRGPAKALSPLAAIPAALAFAFVYPAYRVTARQRATRAPA